MEENVLRFLHFFGKRDELAKRASYAKRVHHKFIEYMRFRMNSLSAPIALSEFIF